MRNDFKMANHTVQMNNESQSEDFSRRYRPETAIIINCILNAPLMLISIPGNALVLAAIIRTPSIRSTHMIMLCSLAVSDLLVGFIADPLFIARELTSHRVLVNLVVVMGYSVCVISLCTMTAISLDRFLALHYHMTYASLVTSLRVKYTLGMIWLTNFLLSGFYFINASAYFFVIASMTVICIITSSFAYICIYRIVRRHQLQIHSQQQAVATSNAENSINMIRLKRSAMNTFVFYIFLIICYSPMYIMLTVNLSKKAIWTKEWNFSVTLVFMNSSINPFLFCWRLRELRVIVTKTIRKIIGRQTENH